MQKLKPAYLGLIICLFVLCLDQASKYYIVHHIMVPPQIIKILPIFDFVLVYNKGISFGLFAQNHLLGIYLLTTISCMITLMLIIWLCKRASVFESAGLGLVIGGAIGNIIDRLHLHAVVDFLHFHWHEYSFPAFNIADSCISLGVFIILIHNFLTAKKVTAL